MKGIYECLLKYNGLFTKINLHRKAEKTVQESNGDERTYHTSHGPNAVNF